MSVGVVSWRTLALVGGSWAAVAGATARAVAPTATGHIAASRGDMGDTLALASITTDTGALAPGIRDFRAFTTPGECVAAVAYFADVGERSLRAQVAAILQDTAIGQDTLPTAAVTTAQRCMAPFTVARLAAGDLPDLFTLALAAGRDSVAAAVVQRALGAVHDAASRAAVYQAAVTGYLAARPARVPAALQSVAALDALGPSVLTARLAAHGALLDGAIAAFDPTQIRTRAAELLTLGRAVPDSAAVPIALFRAYQGLAQVAYVTQPESVTAVVQRAQRDLGRFQGQGWGFPFRTASLEQVRNQLVPFNGEQYAGAPFPPVPATYWLPQRPAGWPPGAATGRPSLIVYGGALANACARSDYGLFSRAASHSSFCYALYTYLAHWAAQYGERLSVTLVAQSQQNSVRSVALTPAQEADSLAWFLRAHLHLPVTVAVVLDSVGYRPPADGRYDYVDTTFYHRFLKQRTAQWGGGGGDESGVSQEVVLFYDGHGQLTYVSSQQPQWPLLQALMARTLAGSGAPASGAASSAH